MALGLNDECFWSSVNKTRIRLFYSLITLGSTYNEFVGKNTWIANCLKGLNFSVTMNIRLLVDRVTQSSVTICLGFCKRSGTVHISLTFGIQLTFGSNTPHTETIS